MLLPLTATSLRAPVPVVSPLCARTIGTTDQGARPELPTALSALEQARFRSGHSADGMLRRSTHFRAGGLKIGSCHVAKRRYCITARTGRAGPELWLISLPCLPLPETAVRGRDRGRGAHAHLSPRSGRHGGQRDGQWPAGLATGAVSKPRPACRLAARADAAVADTGRRSSPPAAGGQWDSRGVSDPTLGGVPLASPPLRGVAHAPTACPVGSARSGPRWCRLPTRAEDRSRVHPGLSRPDSGHSIPVSERLKRFRLKQAFIGSRA